MDLTRSNVNPLQNLSDISDNVEQFPVPIDKIGVKETVIRPHLIYNFHGMTGKLFLPPSLLKVPSLAAQLHCIDAHAIIDQHHVNERRTML
jgi:hypothetical protein